MTARMSDHHLIGARCYCDECEGIGTATFVRTLSDWISGTARLYRVEPPIPYALDYSEEEYDAPSGRATHVVVSYAASVEETAIAASNANGDRLRWLTEWRGNVPAAEMLLSQGYRLEEQ